MKEPTPSCVTLGDETSPAPQAWASWHVRGRRSSRLVNSLEMNSVYALVHYVAHNNNTSSQQVFSVLKDHFHVDHVTHLARKDYEEAIRFLVDLKLDETVS